MDVLWVKGSGGDLGSMKLDGFSTLYLEKLLALETLYRGVEHEDEMVGYLPHCTFNLNPRAASIDTPLHAYLPFAHVDHVHPDAIIALAASAEWRSRTREIWNGAVGWLGWQRPGFDLGIRLRDYVKSHHGLRGVMLAGHGIICWGDSSKACYENTIELIAHAANYLNAHSAKRPAFGGSIRSALPAEERAAVAARLMPRLRALMSEKQAKIGHFSADDAERSSSSARQTSRNWRQSVRRAPIISCVPRSRRWCSMLRSSTMPNIWRRQSSAYRERYAAYYQRCAGANDPAMRDPNPVVVLVPGVGRLTFAADKMTARLAGEFYGNAINVMRGAESDRRLHRSG